MLDFILPLCYTRIVSEGSKKISLRNHKRFPDWSPQGGFFGGKITLLKMCCKAIFEESSMSLIP
jgi:hypothetical protein